MHLVIHPVICNKCVDLLKTVYMFKSQCLKIEESILRYAEKVGTAKINLMDYHKRKINRIEPKNNNNYEGMWMLHKTESYLKYSTLYQLT